MANHSLTKQAFHKNQLTNSNTSNWIFDDMDVKVK